MRCNCFWFPVTRPIWRWKKNCISITTQRITRLPSLHLWGPVHFNSVSTLIHSWECPQWKILGVQKVSLAAPKGTKIFPRVLWEKNSKWHPKTHHFSWLLKVSDCYANHIQCKVGIDARAPFLAIEYSGLCLPFCGIAECLCDLVSVWSSDYCQCSSIDSLLCNNSCIKNNCISALLFIITQMNSLSINCGTHCSLYHYKSLCAMELRMSGGLSEPRE